MLKKSAPCWTHRKQIRKRRSATSKPAPSRQTASHCTDRGSVGRRGKPDAGPDAPRRGLFSRRAFFLTTFFLTACIHWQAPAIIYVNSFLSVRQLLLVEAAWDNSTSSALTPYAASTNSDCRCDYRQSHTTYNGSILDGRW